MLIYYDYTWKQEKRSKRLINRIIVSIEKKTNVQISEETLTIVINELY